MALINTVIRSQAVLRIRDVYPVSRILIFVHPGSWIQKQQQKSGLTKICCPTISFCSHKYHKIENYFIFELVKKKIWANFQRIIELLTQKKLSLSSQKYRFRIRDPGSGKPIPDPGSEVKKAPDPVSATLVTRTIKMVQFGTGSLQSYAPSCAGRLGVSPWPMTYFTF